MKGYVFYNEATIINERIFVSFLRDLAQLVYHLQKSSVFRFTDNGYWFLHDNFMTIYEIGDKFIEGYGEKAYNDMYKKQIFVFIYFL